MAGQLGSNPDWLRLQSKIFSRWVGQKLTKRGIHVGDVVKEMGQGTLLIHLIEVLSETSYPDTKWWDALKKTPPKLRVQQIDAVNNALTYTWAQGIQMKIKPSAEGIVDGLEKDILGLIWAIMLKFMKFGDEEDAEQLNAKDALLLWVKNQTAGYKGIEPIDGFGKVFHDGLILNALIHKNRPKLINYAALNPADKHANLENAMKQAEKYFGIERYLTPEDIPKLDENSMVVYVSEYFYAIAEQRKVDLAAKQINKVITYTKDNDALKVEFNGKSQSLKDHIKKTEGVLADRSIDNTMAGAKKKIEDFYTYKTTEKPTTIETQLDLESLYNTLAMRLSNGKRPEYAPPSGLSLREIEADMTHLEGAESDRKVALYAELNRQIKLVKLDGRHKASFDKLKSWIDEKEAYLKTKEIIESVSAAQLQLRLLDAYDTESASVASSTVVALKKLGAELSAEKYEKISDIQARESEVDAAFSNLGKLSAAKRPVLEDDLAREEFKEKVRLNNKQHIDGHAKLLGWVAEKEAYLNTREKINSVSESRTQISLLESYEKDKETTNASSVDSLKKIGADILAAKYSTQYSSWVFETPEEVKNRESEIDAKWVTLSELSAEKKKVLDDHLAREEFKERVRILNRNHVDKHAKLVSWVAEKEAYLNTRESVTSIAEASTQLSLLDSYEKEKVDTTTNNVQPLKALGADILAQKYETSYSSWVWETPQEIADREAQIDAKWKSLSDLSEEKKRVLDDHLAREQFRENLRLRNQGHIDKHDKLQAWIKEKEDYLNTRENILSVSESQTQLALLASYEKDKITVTDTSVAQLKSLGAEILAAKYETKYSKYVFPTPEEIKSRESAIDAKWVVLSDLSAEKKRVLDDHLAREEFKEKVRTWNRNHTSKHDQIQAWVAEKEAYLQKKESINSVPEAQTQLILLEAYGKEKERTTSTRVVQLKAQGQEILAAKYETKYSSWVFETPEEVKSREDAIDAKWKSLDDLSAEKKKVLDSDLAREKEKERLRLEFAHLASDFQRWTLAVSERASGSDFGFTLEEVEAYKATLDQDNADVATEAATKKTAYDATHKQMTDLGVTENIYTTLSLGDLAKFKTDLDGALASRNSAYDAELARQRANDALCKQFAEMAEQFIKWISSTKESITKSTAELEDQLKNVEGKIASADQDGSKVKDIKDLSAKIEAAGVTNNKHTTVTDKDAELALNQYKSFLNRKKGMLLDEIEKKKSRGMTPAQFKEIQDTFVAFDKDKSGKIDKKELKSCLYSLGEETSKAELERILKEFGDGKVIPYEGFKNFMIGILGTSVEKEDILNSFKLINRGAATGNVELMDLVLEDADLEYIKAVAPKDGNGYDYTTFTEGIFAR